MKNNTKFGAVLAVLGILAGILCLYFVAATYNAVIHTHFNAGDWEESNTVRIVYAVLGWLSAKIRSKSSISRRIRRKSIPTNT